MTANALSHILGSGTRPYLRRVDKKSVSFAAYLGNMEVLQDKYLELRTLYDRAWELRDRRVDGWPLMESPLPTAVICLTYIYVVKVAGPRFMRDREPLDVRKFLIVYNLCQVFFSLYMFVTVSSPPACVDFGGLAATYAELPVAVVTAVRSYSSCHTVQ